MEEKNKELKIQNATLMRDFKECIKQGKKEIQYVSKMQAIMA